MGNVKTITHDQFPVQTGDVGRQVSVIFHYDTGNPVKGTIVRDDGEEPYVTIIRLEDGGHILATECQYSLSLF